VVGKKRALNKYQKFIQELRNDKTFRAGESAKVRHKAAIVAWNDRKPLVRRVGEKCKVRTIDLVDEPPLPTPAPASSASTPPPASSASTTFGCPRCRYSPSGCLSCNPVKTKKALEKKASQPGKKSRLQDKKNGNKKRKSEEGN